MDKQKILICFWDTGGGHRSAAEAIEKAILELVQGHKASDQIDVLVECVIEKNDLFNSLFVGLYNYLLRNHQSWMKYYYWLIQWLKPNDSVLGYKLFGSYAAKLLARVQPAVIVSVHPMINHYLSRGRMDVGLDGKAKLVIVITDPNAELWTGWACADADLIIAPNDLARDRLIELGIPPASVRTIGMPIDPDFVHPCITNKKVLLNQLGLSPEKLTICLSGGWAGSTWVIELYRLLKTVKRPIQVIILCGHNQELMSDMEQEKMQSSLPTAVLPYSESLSSLMTACDLLVTKAGGLTTFEAIARRLPMALDLTTEPMPQEAGTVAMLIEAKLAKPLNKPDDIVSIVETLRPKTNRQARALPTLHELDHVNAIYEIAQILLEFCNPTIGVCTTPVSEPQCLLESNANSVS